MTYVVGPKGQVVISKKIREQLGIGPGWLAVQRLVGDRVEIHFLPPEHERSLAGILRDKCKAPAADEESAWANAARGEWLGE